MLNPATLLPITEDGVPHDCLTVLDIISKPCPDLTDIPNINADCIYFVDGSSLKLSDGSHALHLHMLCVISFQLLSHKLPASLSAQASELSEFKSLHDTGVLNKQRFCYSLWQTRYTQNSDHESTGWCSPS